MMMMMRMMLKMTKMVMYCTHDADDSYDGENYAKYKSQIEVVIKAMLFNLSCTSVLDISKLNS